MACSQLFCKHILLCLLIQAQPVAVVMVTSQSLFTKYAAIRNGNTLQHQTTVMTDADCGTLCLKHSECNSFNLGPLAPSDGGGGGSGNFRSCELVKTDHNSLSTITEDSDWIFWSSGADGIFDCFDLQHDVSESGVYTLLSNIAPQSLNAKDAYCDMDVDGGGWTVIVRRFDGSGDYNRNWDEYKQGFGDASGEYWLGNEYLHYLTSRRAYKLRVDLERWNGATRYAEYSSFAVESEADNYRLLLGEYTGTASDDQAEDELSGFLYHNNSQFSTYDRDNDQSTSDCINTHALYGGFWYNNCEKINPTILEYCTSNHCSIPRNLRWQAWNSNSLRVFEIKMRPN